MSNMCPSRSTPFDEDSLCYHCRENEISEDIEIAAEELCDRCAAEINDQDDLNWSWRKGE